MKDYMVGFLVLLALVGLGVAKENPSEQERLFKVHPTDCSAYYVLQLRQCPRGQLFNTKEQKCDSPGNVNCDCRGEGNACERSPVEDRNGDDYGEYKGDNEENNDNKGDGNREEEDDHGNGGDKYNKDDKDYKHDDDDSDSEKNLEKGSKEDRDEDNDDGYERHGKDKEHHSNKEDRDGDDDGSHEGHGKRKGHHSSKENINEDDDSSNEGHGKRKGNRGSKVNSGEDRRKSVCKKLERIQHGKWLPRQCSKKSQKFGHVCRLQCSGGFDRSGGSQVLCTESGWVGEYGVNSIPTCVDGGITREAYEQSTESPTTTTVEEIGDEFMNIMNNTDGGFEQVLFIVDSSRNVGETTFYRTELNFVKVITEVLFSRILFFGLTTYNDQADVVIPLDEYQSSGFIQRVDDVQYSPRDGSDMANVLDRTFSDIRRSERRTLVVLISGTESSTDGSGEAGLIQSRGNIIMPVVVGEVNRNTAVTISSVNVEGTSLYFVFQSWEIFRSTTNYISQNYEGDSTDVTQPTDETPDYRANDDTTQTTEGEYETTDYKVTKETTTQASPIETRSIEEIGEEVVSDVNGTFTGFQQVLFIVDSSRNVGESTFYNTEMNFVKAMTEIFSRISYFGLITYNDYAEVVIPLAEMENSEFIQRVDSVQYSPRDGSDIANVLDRAFSIIRHSGRRTLVVFISGTESSIDGSGEAKLIKSRGNFIIPLYVGEVNRDTAISISSMNEEGSSVYFLFQNWEIFNATTTYIRQTYTSVSTEVVQVCQALENSQRGHWEASYCSSGTNELGTVCELVCEEGYELSGTPEVTCNQSGWVSYGGGRNMPSCKTIEEIGEDFIADINRTMGKPANLMFVVDGSGSLTEEQFGLETGLVNAIVRAFPLSEDRSAGVVTFSSDATVDVSVSSDDTCTFLSDVSAIKYPRGGTNLAKALQLANNELEQNAVHDFTVTFLITDGISTTDPTEPAAVLKRGDNPLFAIGVGDYDAEQLTSIATYFYPIRDFGIFNSLKNVLETDYASRTNVQC